MVSEYKCTDLRLLPAFHAIDAGKCNLLSLDIFDTLLWRKMPLPADLFLLLGKELKADGWLIDAVTAECFAELRVLAERIVRAKKALKQGTKTAEINLHEIYWNCAGIFNKISIEQMAKGLKGIINESDVDDLVAMEVALEKRLVVFDFNIIALIQHAHLKGVRIALISDTYFERGHIDDLLESAETSSNIKPLSMIEEIFISCEYGCGKKEGLFSTMSDTLQVPPKRILHIGDNFKSDIEPAEKSGMKTLFFPKHDPALVEVLDMEWADPNYHNADRMKLLDSQQGDFGITALRAKLEYDVALQKLQPQDAFYWKYGATVLGPVLAGFVHWIYARCQALGHSKVYCLMREGRLYANLLKQMSSCYPHIPLQVEELWLSRQYVLRACLYQASADELKLVYKSHATTHFTVQSFCESIGLTISQVKKFAKYAHVTMEYETLRNDLFQYVSEQEELRQQVVEYSFKQRQHLLAYLSKTIDLASTSQMMLVDVGFNGTIQGALQMALAMAGYRINVHGLYLGTTDVTHYALLQGFIREGFLMKAGYPESMPLTLRRGLVVIEQVASSGLPPLLDIDEQGNIITGKREITEQQKKQFALVQQGIYAFCNAQEHYLQGGALSWDAQSEPLTNQLRQILTRSMNRPTRQESEKFSRWRHDHRGGFKEFQVFGNDPYYKRFIGDMFPKAVLQDANITWPGGYAAQHDSHLADAFHTVITRAVSPDCFLSHDILPMRITIDTGKGFSTKASLKVSMRSNADRTFFAFETLESIKKPIRQLRFELTSAQSIIRIKSLRLTYRQSSHPDAKQLVFFENDAAIACEASRKIDHNTFYCDADSLVLTYPFEEDDVYAVQIRLCCETFQLTANTNCFAQRRRGR